MAIQILSSIQVIKVFEESTESNWTFNVDWRARRIEVFRENTRLATFVNMPNRFNQDYLQTLMNQFQNVRNLA